MNKLLIIAFVVILFIATSLIVFQKNYQYPSQIEFGISYSPKHAKYLGLDWKEVYLQILDDLKVKNLRIPTFWDVIEKEENQYDFSSSDFMLDEAEKRGAKVILVVGARQPRWPECHYPKWARQQTVYQRQQKTLELIEKVIERYKGNNTIWAYQVENEPFAFWFGEGCDASSAEFLKQEVDLVRRLDSKTIIITDSGEWGIWTYTISFGDILGSSVYTKAYNAPLKTYLNYPVPAALYQLKAAIAKKFNPGKEIMISELQAEPWLSGKDISEKLPQRQKELFTLDDFKSNVEFVKKIGFSQNYLWGVEWWYFMEKMGYPQYLEYAKTLFK